MLNVGGSKNLCHYNVITCFQDIFKSLTINEKLNMDDYDYYNLEAKRKEALETIEKLRAGEKLNLIDSYESALLLSAAEGHLDVIKIFLDQGADVNLVSQVEVQAWINGCGYLCQDSALHSAVRTGQVDVVNLLLERGADLNLKNIKGETALFTAVRRWAVNQLEMVTILIDNGIDVSVQNDDGKTALIVAVQERMIEIVKILVGAGSNLEVRDNDGCTPLLAVPFFSDDSIFEIARFLLSSGANINAQRCDGFTLLMDVITDHYFCQDIAGYYSDPDYLPEIRKDLENFLDELIQGGADLDLVDDEGKTALMVAIIMDKTTLAENLMNAGADLHIKDKEGSTALIHAARHHIYTSETTMLLLALDKLHPDEEGSEAKIFKKVCFIIEGKKEENYECASYCFPCYYRSDQDGDESDGESYHIDLLFQ